MNILLVHSNNLEYEIAKKTKFAEEIKEQMKKGQEKDALVCFLAFEEADNGKENEVTELLVKEIKDVAEQVKSKTVVLYPYVHILFGKKPSSPQTALQIMKNAENELKKSFRIMRAPFGYYKSFKLDAKGHPLAELSREIVSGKTAKSKGAVDSKAVEAENTLVSNWHILDTDGKIHKISEKNGKIEGYNFSKHKKLEKLALYEIAKSRKVVQEPPHVKLMKQLEIADYEEGSDPGNLRYPPNGRLIRKLIELYTNSEMQKYGAMEIESPIMYDVNHPSLKKYLERFPARQYRVQTPNKEVFLRFAACFGQFLMLHDATVSYKHLPVKLYENTKYSFRVEKRGELTGLRRLRTFTMPDCHSFCSDMKQAQEEYLKRLELAMKIQKDIGFKMPDDFEFAIRAVKPYYEENKKFINGMVKKYGKPALLELWDEQFFYFVLKYEFNFVDALGKASALTTDQVDVENGERYELTYIDREGKANHPLILHLSPTGAVERVLYALLEKAYCEQKEGKNPLFPMWLSPTQLRIAPVSDSFVKEAQKLAIKFEENNIRADVDDRNESVAKKVRDSEMDWVPGIIVFGDKEKKSKTLNVRWRKTGKQKSLSIDKLIQEIHKETKGRPFLPLGMPQLLSKRPKFIS